MTNIWLDGFDTYGESDTLSYFAGSYEVGDNVYSTNQHPRTGTSAAQFNNGANNFIGKYIGAQNTVVVGIGMLPNVSASDRLGGIAIGNNDYGFGNPLIPSNLNRGTGFALYRTITNGIELVKYNGNTVEQVIYTSPPGVIPTGVYTYIELKVSNTAGSGTYSIIKNGNVLISTGVIAFAVPFYWSFLAKLDNGGAVSMDDYYIDTSRFNGAQRCYTQFAASDEAPQDWILSSGVDAFALIDDYIINPANYIQGDNLADKSKFGISPVPAASGVVNAVRIVAAQNIVDAGSGNSQQTVTIDAVDYVGDEHSQSTSTEYFNDTFSLFGSGVTLADIAALSIQVEKTL